MTRQAKVGERIYLSGPMRGYPNYNFDAFHRTTRALREQGFIVFCPAEESIRKARDEGRTLEEITFEEWMREDIAAILNVDRVMVLPGWEYSIGARIEVLLANVLGLPITEFRGGAPVKVSITNALNAFVGQVQVL